MKKVADIPRYTTAGTKRRLLETNLFFDRSPAEDIDFEKSLLSPDQVRGAKLYVYYWSGAVMVLGRSQSTSDINLKVCQAEQIPVFKRQSGGSGVLHNRSLNVGVVIPSNHEWAKSVHTLYHHFLSPISFALKRLGIPATPLLDKQRTNDVRTPICFESHSDDSLLIKDKKVFGCAQRRTNMLTHIHGTLLLDLDVSQHSRVFGVPESRISNAITAIPQWIPWDKVAASLIGSLAAALGMVPVRYLTE